LAAAVAVIPVWQAAQVAGRELWVVGAALLLVAPPWQEEQVGTAVASVQVTGGVQLWVRTGGVVVWSVQPDGAAAVTARVCRPAAEQVPQAE
jgi:hypothetical protein